MSTPPDRPHPQRLAGFPFPFHTDTFRYRTNVEAARQPVVTETGRWGEALFDCDADYEDDLARRAAILAREPHRCVALPHMRVAAWDTLIAVLSGLAQAHPSEMTLFRQGETWIWHNARLGVEQRFAFGDDDSLPGGPLHFTGSQVQDDLVLLDQRAGNLYADAGLVTFAADWSLPFVIGLTFGQLHSPVPGPVHDATVIPRAHDLLLHLPVGREIRRTNWIMLIGRHLDMSTEAYPEWGADQTPLTRADLGDRLQLRVELQHLHRLPVSNAILFTIRTYHASLAELAGVPGWIQRFDRVLRELPPELITAKHLDAYYGELLAWLDEIQLRAST